MSLASSLCTLAGTLSNTEQEKRCMLGLCCANSLMFFYGKKLPLQDGRIKNKDQVVAWQETVMPGDVGVMFKGAFPRVLLKLAGVEGPLEQSEDTAKCLRVFHRGLPTRCVHFRVKTPLWRLDK